MKIRIDRQRLKAACETVCQHLLSLRNQEGHWTGRLSTSALSTATAVMALHQYRKNGGTDRLPEIDRLIEQGSAWLINHQNEDGGWGDTVKSYSNISTTMLAHAVLHATGKLAQHPNVFAGSDRYIRTHGGVEAVVTRYGKDKTFSVPILTHCALAGLVNWRDVPPLPFEQACLPHQWYAAIGLPVVSYALPALIAIGQVRQHFRKPWNLLVAWLRDACIPRSLRILRRIQPEHGGFLEAAPLTSFVTMSLAAKGLCDHVVVKKGVEFLINSVLPDGSWPIDTNLATWVTTLSVNALGDALPVADRQSILDWLLAQQYKEVHPYTHAAPGGWAWTNLPGGVPDADDTPGAMLAIRKLANESEQKGRVAQAEWNAVRWLVSLQNRDGGWPTFCRGWGALPFDRSAADISAHVMRALLAWQRSINQDELGQEYDLADDFDGVTIDDVYRDVESALSRGFKFLDKVQQHDGSWLPLWFGNQDGPDDINPTYGTSRVLMLYREAEKLDALTAKDGLRWLRSNQNPDGGWGGVKGAPSSVEETSLALDALFSEPEKADEIVKGLHWLLDQVDAGLYKRSTPIGFYFAKLWYFEELYPVIFAAGTLRRAWTYLESFQVGTASSAGKHEIAE